MDRYVCTICGHEYDPSRGESRMGIPAGMVFEKLPASWQCPVCGAGQALFKKA